MFSYCLQTQGNAKQRITEKACNTGQGNNDTFQNFIRQNSLSYRKNVLKNPTYALYQNSAPTWAVFHVIFIISKLSQLAAKELIGLYTLKLR